MQTIDITIELASMRRAELVQSAARSRAARTMRRIHRACRSLAERKS